MNGVNLDQFAFEFDLTWMAFFQNSEGQTYARYGGRDDRDAESFLSKESLLLVMRRVLYLHEEKDIQTIGRYEPDPPSVQLPGELPGMQSMISKREESCIHCHDVKVARLRQLRREGRLEKDMVFTYPAPINLGIGLDPDAQNVVYRVIPGSPAEVAGLRAGDILETAEGQRVLSFGDLTRVLELAPETGEFSLVVNRQRNIIPLVVSLAEGWRKSADPSWRPSLEAIGPGAGFWGAKLDDADRAALGLGQDDLAMRVNFIWGEWTRQAGIQKGDIVISIDGQKNDMNIRQLHGYLQLNRNYGDTIPLQVRRADETLELTMQLPELPDN